MKGLGALVGSLSASQAGTEILTALTGEVVCGRMHAGQQWVSDV